MDLEFGRAIVAYLGFGSASSPRQDKDRLIKEYGTEPAAEIEKKIASILDELGKIDVNWNVHTLASAGDLARHTMHSRHPELSEEALRALEWKFTFDWK